MTKRNKFNAANESSTYRGAGVGRKRKQRSATMTSLLGAIFLMGTSAIGPGFLTQTATFTQQLGAAFSFGILISVIVDLAIQLNVWRVIGISGKRAQELAQIVLPGSGVALSIIVIICGFIANMGNVAGAGLGLNVLFEIDARWGAAIGAAIGIVIFMNKRFGVAMDRLLIPLGIIMIGLTVYVAFEAQPPLAEAARQTILPDRFDAFAVTTIIGGSVGGYITFAGAHKLIDSGITGAQNAKKIQSTANWGVLATAVMRWILFLAVLGVVTSGTVLDTTRNPAGDAFQAAAGVVGYKIFGVVLFAAALSSIIGASFTSVTFIVTYSDWLKKRQGAVTVVFITLTAIVFLLIGQTPATVLVFSGGFNGLVLPFGFTIIMWIAYRRTDLLHGARYPRFLLLLGTIGLILSWILAFLAFEPVFELLQF